MKVSVDISMYPLKPEFETAILAFIHKLKSSDFTVLENPLSTQIYGDYDAVMAFIIAEMKAAFLNENNCVFTMKFIKGDRSL